MDTQRQQDIGRATTERLVGFFKRFMESYMEHEFSDIDGGDVHEWLIRSGLAFERPATEADCETDWAQDYDISVGDTITDYSPAQAIIAKFSKAKP